MDVFFSDTDRTAHLALLAKYAKRYGVAFLAWCLTAKLLAYIERFNQEKRIFQWTKTADDILRSRTSLTRH